MERSEAKRAAVAQMRQAHRPRERRAYGLIDQPRSTQRYTAKPTPDNGLRRRIAELAAARPRR